MPKTLVLELYPREPQEGCSRRREAFDRRDRGWCAHPDPGGAGPGAATTARSSQARNLRREER
eukprot:5915494-Pyramimonas_sp.AAC.1